MKFNEIKLDEFKKIKAGDKIYCASLGGVISQETAVGDAFYNYDADEPDWEVETNNGFICWDSVYVPEFISPFPDRSVKEEDEIFELAKFIGDYNMKKGSIDERYLPYVKEVATAHYDAGWRKAVPQKPAVVVGEGVGNSVSAAIDRFVERLKESYPESDRNNTCPEIGFDFFCELVDEVATEFQDNLEEGSPLEEDPAAIYVSAVIEHFAETEKKWGRMR